MPKMAIFIYYSMTMATTCLVSLLYQQLSGNQDWSRGLIVGLCFGLFWSIGTHLKAPEMIANMFDELMGRKKE